ncbi:MAG: DUF2207 domain-containing protein [Pleurocapsa sp. SU_196_0]|nr:DUF2207 domain-containing protein [Pleurocapsa sp. SU_196_0]
MTTPSRRTSYAPVFAATPASAKPSAACRGIGTNPRTANCSIPAPRVKPRRGRSEPFIAGAASLFGGFFLLESLTPVGVGLMIAGVLNILLGVVASVALPRWKPDKLLNAKRWTAYKNFLTDFSAMNQAPAEHLKLWDYHFVYASALGVSQKYLENVKRLAEAHPNYYHSPVWIPYYGGITGPGIGNNVTGLADQLVAINSLSSIATNLSSLESALNPSSSGSSGGFGGGSSGGSSGGGGSSSAG